MKTDLGRSEFLWLNGNSGFGVSVLVRALAAIVHGAGRREPEFTSKARRHQEVHEVGGSKIRSGHLIDGGGAAGKKIPAGNEKRIPAGDGDPFSL